MSKQNKTSNGQAAEPLPPAPCSAVVRAMGIIAKSLGATDVTISGRANEVPYDPPQMADYRRRCAASNSRLLRSLKQCQMTDLRGARCANPATHEVFIDTQQAWLRVCTSCRSEMRGVVRAIEPNAADQRPGTRDASANQ